MKTALFPFQAVRKGMAIRYWYVRDMAIGAVGCWIMGLISVGHVVVNGDWSWVLYATGLTVLGVVLALGAAVLMDYMGPD